MNGLPEGADGATGATLGSEEKPNVGFPSGAGAFTDLTPPPLLLVDDFSFCKVDVARALAAPADCNFVPGRIEDLTHQRARRPPRCVATC